MPDQTFTEPLYQQIADDLRGKIRNGEYPQGGRIPTEFALGEAYRASRITVRKALEMLVDEGVLVRRPRLGTFVRDRKLSRNLSYSMGFSKLCEENGDKPGTELISAELVPVREPYKTDLQLSDGEDRMIRIRRLRLCNNEPVILEENHFPRSFAYLLSEDLNGSLYAILDKHGVLIGTGAKTIGICFATKEEAERLKIKEKTALLLSKDLVCDTEGNPVFSGKEIINSDRFEYRIRQEPHPVTG